MTAAELYEIVKDDFDVWGDTIDYGHGRWYDVLEYHDVSLRLATVALEGAYARATGCGVWLSQYARGDQEYVAERPGFGPVYKGPTRLAALRAAYRANKETKR